MELNHTIVWCSDTARSAGFAARMLGRPEPRRFLHFLVVDLDNGVSLDFMQKEGPVSKQYDAFRRRGAHPAGRDQTGTSAGGASTSRTRTGTCLR